MPPETHEASTERALVCRVGSRRCFVPLAAVIEIMRPLPIVDATAKLAMIRGELTRVVDAAALLNLSAPPATRYVLLRAGAKALALAVSEVLGVHLVDSASLGAARPLLREARADAISLASLDDDALMALRMPRISAEGAPDGEEAKP